jgi:AhpC/TSA family
MSLLIRHAILTSAAVCFAAGAWTNSATTLGLHVTDLDGRNISQLAPANAHVVVLIFAATDCPISKRYIPEIARLQKEFSSQGVSFWWVFPNPGDTAAVVRKHELDYSIHSATLIDSRQELAHLAHVSVTPEAAVFAVNGTNLHEVYHGRIDDRYLSFSRSRPAATSHDLEDAIKSTLAGRTVAPPAASPVGCSIVPVNLQQ